MARNGKGWYIEGANQQSVNVMAVHTNAGCAVGNTTVSSGSQGNTNGQLAFSGQMTTMNCDVNAAGQGQNVGCSIQVPIKPFPPPWLLQETSLVALPYLPTVRTSTSRAAESTPWSRQPSQSVSGSSLIPEPYPTTSQAILPTPVAGVPRWPSSPGVAVTSRLASRT